VVEVLEVLLVLVVGVVTIRLLVKETAPQAEAVLVVTEVTLQPILLAVLLGVVVYIAQVHYQQIVVAPLVAVVPPDLLL
jgi:hypothetical protein